MINPLWIACKVFGNLLIPKMMNSSSMLSIIFLNPYPLAIQRIPKAYPIGCIPIADNYHALVTKVVAFETTYYDLYLFDENGTLKLLVNLYEAEHERPGYPGGNSKVYIQSSITKDGIIKWHEERFNVTTDREYQLQSDGYFKIIKQNVEGEFEY